MEKNNETMSDGLNTSKTEVIVKMIVDAAGPVGKALLENPVVAKWLKELSEKIQENIDYFNEKVDVVFNKAATVVQKFQDTTFVQEGGMDAIQTITQSAFKMANMETPEYVQKILDLLSRQETCTASDLKDLAYNDLKDLLPYLQSILPSDTVNAVIDTTTSVIDAFKKALEPKDKEETESAKQNSDTEPPKDATEPQDSPETTKESAQESGEVYRVDKETFDALRNIVNEIRAAARTQELASNITKAQDNIQKAESDTKDVAKKTDDVTDKIKKSETDAKSLGEKARDVFKKIDEAQKMITKLKSVTQLVQDALKSIGEGLIQLSQISFAQTQKEAEAQLKALEEKYKGTDGLIEQTEQAIKDFHEQQKQEEAKRREQEEEEAYEHQQEVYKTEIEELETALATETNVKEAKRIEQELEKQRRKKREAQEKREEDKKEKERQLAKEKEEKALQKQKQLREWEYETKKVEIQNHVGTAKAKADRQAAVVSKATQSAQATAEAVKTSAMGILHVATPGMRAVGAMEIAAAAMVLGTIGSILAIPLPAEFDPAPLPERPFATGGIVPSRPGGLPITFGLGQPGVMSEAGLDEMVLPLNQVNIDHFLKPFAKSTPQTDIAPSLTYAPHINIQLDASQSPEETLAYIKENLQRDLFEAMEEAQERFRLCRK